MLTLMTSSMTVALFEYQSGTRIYKDAHTSSSAKKQLKHHLHMTSMNAVRYHLELRQYYERKVEVGKNKGRQTRIVGWAVALSPILKNTVPKARLRKRDFEPMLDYYHIGLKITQRLNELSGVEPFNVEWCVPPGPEAHWQSNSLSSLYN